MIVGKLKHSLKERCPDCRSILQLRVLREWGIVNGVEFSFDKEIIVCSKCTYQEETKQKRKKHVNDISMEV